MESAAIAVLQLVREIHNIAVQVEENRTLCVELSLECDLIVPPVEVLQNSPLETRCADALNSTLKLLNKVKKYVEKYGEKTFSRTVRNLMWESRRGEIERFKSKLRFCMDALTFNHVVEANVAATAAREAPLITEESNKQKIAEQLTTLRICIARGSVAGSISATRIGFFREDLAETQSVINDLRLPYPAAESVAYRNEIAELSTLVNGLTARCTLETLAADLRDLYQQPLEASVLLMDTDDNVDTINSAAVSYRMKINIDDLFVNLSIVDKLLHEEDIKTAIFRTSQINGHHDSSSDNPTSPYWKSFLTQPRDIRQHADFNLGALYDDDVIFGQKPPIDVASLFSGESEYTEALLLGKAGVGKTTLCRYLAYQWAIHKLWPAFQFVFFIQLKEIASLRGADSAKEKSVPYILWFYLVQKFIPDEDQWTSLWVDMQRKNVLFILDGHDQIEEKSNIMCRTLVNARDCPDSQRIKVLVTSRPHVHIGRKVDLVIESIGFTKENIHAYIARYYTKIACVPDCMTVARELCAYLDQHPNIMQMCKVPINLELMCSIWRAEHNRLKNEDIVMSDLYEMFLSKLMLRYVERNKESTMATEVESSRIAFPSATAAVMRNVDCVNSLHLLEEIAFLGFLSGQIIIPSTIVQALLKKYKMTCLEFYNEVGLLKAVGDVNVPYKELYFVQLSFQEYLVARFFVRHIYGGKMHELYTIEVPAQDNGDPYIYESSLKDVMVHNKYNPRFLLVWMFASGLLRSYEPVIQESDSKRVARVDAGFENFFSILLGKNRDLYGMYELELIMRCGEEAKWSNSALLTNFLEYLGRWTVRITCRDLTKHIAHLYMACPLTMAVVTHGRYRGLVDILTHKSNGQVGGLIPMILLQRQPVRINIGALTVKLSKKNTDSHAGSIIC